MKTLVLCLVVASALVAAAPVASAAPECYQIYREYEAGPVTVVQRSSCEYEVCVEGDCDWLK